MVQTLYLMMGLPGAGKTTTAKTIEQLSGAIRLTSDEARVVLFDPPLFTEEEHQILYDYLNDQTDHLLAAGKSVIYDANLNRREHREEKYQLARKHNIQAVLIWVKTPEEIAKQRAADLTRKHLWAPNETPLNMFERIAATIEEPGQSEKYIELDGTQITKEYIKNKLMT